MASIDKAAIAFSIAITVIGAGFAFVGDSGGLASSPTPVAPVPAPTPVPEDTQPSTTTQQVDPFADIAERVRSEAAMRDGSPTEDGAMMEEEGSMMMEEEGSMTGQEGSMMMEEEGTMMMEEEMVMESSPTVDIPAGTSFPGCEETNECYLPPSITVTAGDTVEWTNSDTAVHTVTSGSPSTGPTGTFDSSLIAGGQSYTYTFDEAGSYDYFCIVHPWMIGSVTVN